MLTLSEAHQILEKIDVEKADQIQKRTLDYTSKFAKTTPEVAKEAEEAARDRLRPERGRGDGSRQHNSKIHRGAQDVHCGLAEAPPDGDAGKDTEDTKVQRLNSKEALRTIRRAHVTCL